MHSCPTGYHGQPHPRCYDRHGCRCDGCRNLYSWSRYKTVGGAGVRGPNIYTTPGPGDWVENAACAHVDPEMFFPLKGVRNQEAKAICAGCPVMGECADYGLTYPWLDGVWGGLSDHERRKIRSKGAA